MCGLEYEYGKMEKHLFATSCQPQCVSPTSHLPLTILDFYGRKTGCSWKRLVVIPQLLQGGWFLAGSRGLCSGQVLGLTSLPSVPLDKALPCHTAQGEDVQALMLLPSKNPEIQQKWEMCWATCGHVLFGVPQPGTKTPNARGYRWAPWDHAATPGDAPFLWARDALLSNQDTRIRGSSLPWGEKNQENLLYWAVELCAVELCAALSVLIMFNHVQCVTMY